MQTSLIQPSFLSLQSKEAVPSQTSKLSRGKESVHILPRPRLETLQAYVLPKFGNSPEEDPFYAVREFATRYTPRQVNGYTIHNSFFTPFDTLNAKQLRELFHDLKQKGSFTVQTNPQTGLIQTSDKKNGHHMSRQWFTDGGMMFYLQRDTAPALWRKNLITNAAALNNQEAKSAVQSTVTDPNWYRKGDIKNGVFHIYWPASVELDEQGIPKPEKIQLDETWFNQKRLESQALMLLRFVQTVEGGLVPDKRAKTKPWGFTPEELNSKAGEYVLTAMVDLAHYLLAVNTDPKSGEYDFQPPSSSTWEEVPFLSGCTWDAALTVVAFEQLKQLLYQDKANPQLNEVRQKILTKAPVLTEKKLNRFIEAGRKFVDSRITEPLKEGKTPMQAVERPFDSSLTLLAGSPYRFAPKNHLEDAKLRLQLVQKSKHALLGVNGMRRYNEFELPGEDGQPVKLHDSYLNIILPPIRGEHAEVMNHATFKLQDQIKAFQAERKRELGDKAEPNATDISYVKAMLKRQAISAYRYSAEWQLGFSASLQAMNQAKMDVLQHVQKAKKASPEAKQLLADINQETLDLINRNVAAIPGPLPSHSKIIRPDGTEYPHYKPVEAYQAVMDLNRKVKWVPGEHILPWHISQLYDGLKNAIVAQELEDKLQREKLLR